MNITAYHASDSGYITICNLSLSGTPATVEIDGETLYLKSELHISLISLKRLAPLINPDDPEKAAAQLTDAFLDFVKTQPLDSYTLTGEYYMVHADERKTIVALCNVPGLNDLFEFLNRQFAMELPVQPAHITLYTLQPEKGIGVLSEAELHAIGHPITPSALSAVHKST